ncbi:choline transporter-like protein 5 isoform X2 [Cavia porcellus]|uniref:choline transporter-like protein 5 isoform X2 n=1 Tax=Cavia porcellus TaxID=10141 RepID=UPI002FE036F3
MARKRRPPSAQGEPRTYDSNFKGPVTNRNCTDFVCCVIFLVFIMGYILLGLMAWAYGDPRRLTFATDSQGHFCGQKGTPYENKTTLFYFNMLRCTSPSVVINLQCPTTQICVAKCPEKFLTYVEMQILYKTDSRYWEYYRQFCKPTAKPVSSVPALLLNEDCPSMIFPSKPFLQRCFPDFIKENGTLTIGHRMHFEDGRGRMRTVLELREAANGINKILNAREIAFKVFEDYATSWYWIVIGLTIAMILSWIFLVLLRFIVGFLFWFFVLGVLHIIAYGIFYCYQQYNKLQKKPESLITLYNIGIQTNMTMYFQLKQTWFVLMIILVILEMIIILLLIFLRRRIRLAIVLLKEGSKAIGYIPSTLVYPAFTFILLLICFSYWVVTAVSLATSGVPVYKVSAPEGPCVHENETCNPTNFNATDVPKECPGALCNFAFYGGKSLYHQYISTLHWYNIFVFLWLVNFVFALGQCTLAGAFASYYWAMKKPDDIPSLPLFTSFGQAIRYHTGSLAFGSLIIAVVHLFKMILEYLDRHLKNAQSHTSKFLKYCLTCCFWCLEKMVKFLNRNAYIMIAIHGKNFCMSARDAFNLLMRNILKVAVTDEVTHFVLLLGKLLVTSFIGLLAFLLFTEKTPAILGGPTSLNYYWVPLLTVILGSYLVAHGCFSVYTTCIETIFLCFCEDLEGNDGSPEKPYFITPSLHEVLVKKQPVLQKQKK